MLPYRYFFLIAITFFVCLPVNAQTPKKRPITLEDLWKVKRLGKPSISPDGKWVAVDVTTFSMEQNNSNTQIWLCSTDGKTQKQLTKDKASSTSPIWSPDGKNIAFTRVGQAFQPDAGGEKRQAGKPDLQIHVISPNGGKARQVSKLPMNASGLKWGADSKTIYCVVWTWPDTPDDASYLEKAKAKKADKVQAYIIDDALYRVWDKWIADGKRPVVFAVNVENGSHRNLFAGVKRSLPVSGGTSTDYDVSPDGKEICFTSESAKELGMDYNLDLYVMPIQPSPRRKPGVEPKNITLDNPANDTSPKYSPDGRHVGFLRQKNKFFYADTRRLLWLDRKTRKFPEELEDHDFLTFATGRIKPQYDRSVSRFDWLQDDLGVSGVYFEMEDQGQHRLGMAAVRGAGILLALTSGHSDRDLAVSKGMMGAFVRSHFGLPGTLQIVIPKGDAAKLKLEGGHAVFDPPLGTKPLEKFNADLVSQWDLGEVKNVTYKGADNDDVQMWIVYPPKFDATKKWPCLMMIHGGPHNAITTDFHYRWNAHLFASKGYVVAIPNFHGSSGFGQKFCDSITGDMATKPFIDVMKATDYMESKPYIDKTRTTAAGASYGGYMMAWLNGHTDRYKAMVCHAGVYNWHSMMASDFVRSRERPLGALPFGDQSKIDKQNPQRFAKNFKTPTLVMHGEKDFRVPVTQGMEYYNTLRIKGVPSRFVYFPDENHWIMKPQNSRLWHREFFAWLEKYVGSGPTK
ncbi:MAG: S9 family peptidase [Planctomycetes bacterium]|nr:S9 family peptidase [Planctomycetota bacterium]